MGMTEELRKARINALKKERANNNARVKAELMALGVKFADRKPPPSPFRRMDDTEMLQRIKNVENSMNNKLSHIESVVSYQANPLTNREVLASNELTLIRGEISEMQEAITALANQVALFVTKKIEPAPIVNRLAHVEAVACCQARVPYDAVPHKYVQVPPPIETINNKVAPHEIDKVKDEILHVKDAVHTLINSFSSYNIGKMHGAVDSLRGTNGTPQMMPQSIIQQVPQQDRHRNSHSRVERVSDRPGERIVEVPVERVVEKIVEVPVERVVEKIVEKPVDRPVESKTVERVIEKQAPPIIIQTPQQQSQRAPKPVAVASTGNPLQDMLAKMSAKLDGLADDMKD